MSARARDEKFMALALAQAHRGLGWTSPNPPVGAVIVRGGRVIAAGYHRAAGRPHAEIEALRRAGKAARGATIYVTLEPCNHQGRTPPCTRALLDAGIRRVVVGCRDENPHVRGGGGACLRRAGLAVTTGVLARECRQLAAPFFKFIRTGRPYVTLKSAMTLDGQLAAGSGDARWITGPAARRIVHQLRARVDAIITGVGTILADDPRLTARGAGHRLHQPVRVVLDTSLRTPVKARILREPGGGPVLIATSAQAPRRKAQMLRAAGAEIVNVKTGAERGLALAEIVRELGRRGLLHVLIEAGGSVNGSFWRAGLVDELLLFIAPKVIGSSNWPLFSGLGAGRMNQAVDLVINRQEQLGNDLMIWCRPRPRTKKR